MTMTELYKSFVVMMLVSGTSGNYVRVACNWAKSLMQLVSCGLVTPDLGI